MIIIKFIKAIPSFFRLFRDYGYDGNTCTHIIENYTEVLCNRTRGMSKPTYDSKAVMCQLDEWYEQH